MCCLKCSHVNIWDLGSSAWMMMRRVLNEQVLYLSYVLQINMHGQHMFWVCVDFIDLYLAAALVPITTGPDQFKVYKHTDSFVNIDETYPLKYTYHVCILQEQMCVWNQLPGLYWELLEQIPFLKIYCKLGYTKGANVSVSSHIMNIGSSMIACCKALFLSFNLML